MTRAAMTAVTFGRDEQGATMVEYAVMLLLIALVCFAAVQLVGLNLNALFSDNDLRDAL